MEEKTADVYDFPSVTLKRIYQHPASDDGKYFIAMALSTVFFVVLFATAFIHLPLAIRNANLFVENFEALGLFIMAFGKLVVFAIKRKTLGNLFEKAKLFWTTESCSTELKEKLDNMANVTVHLQKTFMYLLTMSLLLSAVHPYFTKQLLLGIWMIKGHDTMYYVVLGLQEVFIPYLVLHNGATDGLFVGFCMSTIIQFKMLKSYFRNLDMENISKDHRYLNFAIEHHIFLLKYIEEVKQLYSPVMLVEYTSLVLIFCSELFILTASKLDYPVSWWKNLCFSTDVALLGKHIVITVTVLMQLFFYCTIVDYVNNEASGVSYAIYESNWYTGNLVPLRNIIPFVTRRAQKEITFTAGGLYDMNTKTLVNILKLAWSICVALKTT